METASNLPETELTLECPQCAFDARSVLPAVPGHPGLRMHAVDHDVHVRVVPVLMRDHERLVFGEPEVRQDRKSTRLNSSHLVISYAVFCLKKKKNKHV